MKSFRTELLQRILFLPGKKSITKDISQTIKGVHQDIRSSDTPPSLNPNHQSTKQSLPHCLNSQTPSFSKKQAFSLGPSPPQPV
jgi:hypothetical protein